MNSEPRACLTCNSDQHENEPLHPKSIISNLSLSVITTLLKITLLLSNCEMFVVSVVKYANNKMWHRQLLAYTTLQSFIYGQPGNPEQFLLILRYYTDKEGHFSVFLFFSLVENSSDLTLPMHLCEAWFNVIS